MKKRTSYWQGPFTCWRWQRVWQRFIRSVRFKMHGKNSWIRLIENGRQLQILLRALPTASLAILDEIIYATMRHLDSWAAMDCLDSLAGAIFDRFCSFAHGDERPKHQHPMAWELARKATLSDTHADVLRRWLTRDQHVSKL